VPDTIESLLSEFRTLREVPNDRLYSLLLENRDQYTEFVQQNGFEALSSSSLGQEVIRRCEQDVLWLAGWFCWETNPEGAGQPHINNALREDTHGRIAKFYVQKDKTKALADQDKDIKTRGLLWPRGGIKSTLTIVEAVQWILNFPHIRICFITATDPLAFGLVEELKAHFVLREETPTLMNLFFPEWCVSDEDFVASQGYRCPKWYNKNPGTKRKESTVNAISIGANISGRHYEVMIADDVVSNDNATSVEQCAKISKDFGINKKTLRPWGYVYKVGTRYLDDDMYGIDIEKLNIGDVTITTDGPCVEIITNTSLKTSFMIARAIVIKPEVKKRIEDEGRQVSYIEAGPEGCDFLLPKLLDYSKLLMEWRDDEFIMEGQYNQNPRIQTATAFDLPLLQRNTIPISEMPMRGPISQTWDFAFSRKKDRDFCVCSTVVWDEKGGMVVIDLIRQRFTPLDLAKAVVSCARKWRPFVIGIENAAGSDLIEPTIISEALKTGDPATIAVCSKIDWIKPTKEDGAKQTRMAALHPYLFESKLRFVAHLPYLKELYSEFQKCLLHKQTKNDIPDSISRQLTYAPRMNRMLSASGLPGAKNFGPQMTPMPNSRAQAEYNLMFGPWLSDSELPADAFGRLGFGEVPQPLVEVKPSEPEPAPRNNQFSDGLGSMIDW